MNAEDKNPLARYRRLPRDEKTLVRRALGTLTGTWLCCRLLGASYVRRRLAPAPVNRALEPDPDHAQTAANVILAVNRASRGSGIGACLVRSLAIQSMLRRRGIEARVRLGAAGGRRGEPFAHAWVEGPGIPAGAGNRPGRNGSFARRGRPGPGVSPAAPVWRP